MHIVRFASVGPETARAGLICGAERKKMVFSFFSLDVPFLHVFRCESWFL